MWLEASLCAQNSWNCRIIKIISCVQNSWNCRIIKIISCVQNSWNSGVSRGITLCSEFLGCLSDVSGGICHTALRILDMFVQTLWGLSPSVTLGNGLTCSLQIYQWITSCTNFFLWPLLPSDWFSCQATDRLGYGTLNLLLLHLLCKDNLESACCFLLCHRKVVVSMHTRAFKL